MTTPAGSPAWERGSDHETYGGSTNKINYMSQGAINGRTDVDVTEFLRMVADLAAVVKTAPFTTFTFTCEDTVTDDPTLNDSISMTGSDATGTRVGDGDTRWTWATSYNDPYSVSGSVHIIGADATVQGSTAATALCELEDPNGDGLNERIRVRVFDSAGSAVADAKVTVTVYTGPVA